MFNKREYYYEGMQHVGLEDLLLELLWAFLPMEDVVAPGHGGFNLAIAVWPTAARSGDFEVGGLVSGRQGVAGGKAQSDLSEADAAEGG